METREEEEEEKDPVLPLPAKPMSHDWPSALQAQLSVLTNKYVQHHFFYTVLIFIFNQKSVVMIMLSVR